MDNAAAAATCAHTYSTGTHALHAWAGPSLHVLVLVLVLSQCVQASNFSHGRLTRLRHANDASRATQPLTCCLTLAIISRPSTACAASIHTHMRPQPPIRLVPRRSVRASPTRSWLLLSGGHHRAGTASGRHLSILVPCGKTESRHGPPESCRENHHRPRPYCLSGIYTPPCRRPSCPSTLLRCPPVCLPILHGAADLDAY